MTDFQAVDSLFCCFLGIASDAPFPCLILYFFAAERVGEGGGEPPGLHGRTVPRADEREAVERPHPGPRRRRRQDVFQGAANDEYSPGWRPLLLSASMPVLVLIVFSGGRTDRQESNQSDLPRILLRVYIAR